MGIGKAAVFTRPTAFAANTFNMRSISSKDVNLRGIVVGYIYPSGAVNFQPGQPIVYQAVSSYHSKIVLLGRFIGRLAGTG
ncbi:MAG: hypothetical protein U5J63_04555 [Fodinibius sp.]|nr:hypothetical protein [Fodinibius sp.]